MKSNRKKISPLRKMALVTSIAALSFGFIPGAANAAISPLTLGTASTYGVLASSAITNAAASAVTGTAGGDIGVGGGTAPTGVITYSGAQILAGTSLAAITAASASLADTRTGTSSAVELGSRTLAPGAYDGGTFEVNGTLTLDGGSDPAAVFILRAASTLVTGVSSSVVLTNGAQACNVFWQIGSSATLGGSSTMVGHVIAQASISTGVTTVVNGQLIAIAGAVTLGGTTITNNSCAPAVVAATTPVATAAPVAAAPPVAPATLHVIKLVINKYNGTKTATDFLIHVKRGGVDAVGDANTGVASPGRAYTLPPGTYSISEVAVTGYRGEWVGPITQGGGITLTAGEDVTVTRINYDMNPYVRPVPVQDTTTAVVDPPVVPTKPTTTGGKLPDTSTPWGNGLLFGGALLVIGAMGLVTRKVLVK